MAEVLTPLMREPSRARGLSLPEWDRLVRQARRAGLLPRLALALQEAAVEAPQGPAVHLQAALTLAQAQREEVQRELRALLHSLAPLEVPVVLLKGAAYVAAALAPSRARLFSDIDILVPRERLGELEARLMSLGWATTHLSAYDQRYYRRWMHELPPMVHTRRGTSLDIHHNILPLTSRTPPDARLLLADARPLPQLPGAHVLAPADMVLHSLVHLFHNEETANALRDLSDVDLLLRHWGENPSFWRALAQRAAALRALPLLGCALRQAVRIFHTPVPDATLAEIDASVHPARRAALEALWRRAFVPQHSTCEGLGGRSARAVQYLRAHWLRMPPWLLATHLGVKALGLNRPPAPAAATVAPGAGLGEAQRGP